MRSIYRGKRKIGCEICEEYAKAGGNEREYMQKKGRKDAGKAENTEFDDILGLN